jgi:hypothetical protein
MKTGGTDWHLETLILQESHSYHTERQKKGDQKKRFMVICLHKPIYLAANE